MPFPYTSSWERSSGAVLYFTMRYFMNVRSPDGSVVEDPEGEEFDTLENAVAEAQASARELMADALRANGPVGIDRLIDLADETGQVIATISFRDAIAW